MIFYVILWNIQKILQKYNFVKEAFGKVSYWTKTYLVQSTYLQTYIFNWKKGDLTMKVQRYWNNYFHRISQIKYVGIVFLPLLGHKILCNKGWVKKRGWLQDSKLCQACWILCLDLQKCYTLFWKPQIP